MPARGATLLEVLVVAVILLVGIFTVVRMFPVGFDVIDKGGQIAMANGYGQQCAAQLAANPANLPDDFLPAPQVKAFADGVAHFPVGLDIPPQGPKGPSDQEGISSASGDAGLQALRNALFQFRRVYGETTRVSAGAPRYLLQFGPFEAYAPAGGFDKDLLTVYCLDKLTKVSRAELDNHPNDDGYYAVDSNGALWFSGVSVQRTYKVDYALLTQNGTVERVVDTIVFVPDSAGGAAVQAESYETGQPFQFGGTGGGSLVADSEVVRRRFRDSGSEGSVNDPYAYAFADNTVGALQLAVNGSTSGKSVGIDYSVMDWSILHDDFDAPRQPDPGSADRAWLKLTFPFVDTSPICPGDNRTPMQQPVLIQDIDSNSPTYGMLIDGNNANSTWSFDDPIRRDQSRAGRIGLLVSAFTNTRRIRVFYRTMDGYAAQVIKPCASYTQETNPAAGPSFDRYVLSGTRLQFAPMDIGKSVSVDYTYHDGTALRRVTGEMHTIDDSGYVNLNNVPGGNAIASIDAVTGASLVVRVYWAQRGTPNRMFDLLNSGWNPATPTSPVSFWQDLKGRLAVVDASVAVMKPAGQ